ncbi:MAG TPA: hypothetical protein VG838_14590 [Opitutaceae bacterium]|nr:hypothetical protein [Opitutaceae bacterium]
MSTSPSSRLFLCSAALAALSLSGCLLPQSKQTVLFTEDFESGPLKAGTWDVRTGGNAEVTVQSAQVAHGKSALKVHYPMAGRPYGFAVVTHLPEALKSHNFGRVYMYISPGMPAGHGVLVTGGSAGFPQSNYLEVGVSGGKNIFLSYQRHAPGMQSQETMARGGPYPVGKWFLLEWEFNDNPDKTTVWIDGELAKEKAFVLSNNPKEDPLKEVDPKDGTSTGLVGNFAELALGFRSFSAAKADFDLYYDDLAIGTERIGPVK